jgi:hypothetical protein
LPSATARSDTAMAGSCRRSSPSGLVTVQHAAFAQHLQVGLRVGTAEALACRKGSSKAAQPHRVEQISGWSGWMRACSGWPPAEEIRMPHEVLVERLRASHEHAQRRLLPAAGAAQALPGGRTEPDNR